MHFMTLLRYFKALFNSLRPINIAVDNKANRLYVFFLREAHY
jgi:hypothetical protein